MMGRLLRLALLALCLLPCYAKVSLGATGKEVAIIAHEPGYYTSLANHASRWLREQGISAPVSQAKDLSTSLAGAKVAFLVGFDAPSAAEIKALRDYRGRGGKLVVFYSSSPALADLMGVKVLGYKKAAYPGQWSRMNFTATFPEGLPASIRQTSTVLQSAQPLPGKGRVMATWVDRKGSAGILDHKPQGIKNAKARPDGEAAWISTAGGYWMTHVLLADGDESLKARLLAALVGSIAPELWNAKAADAKARAERATLRAYAKKQIPRKGEIHAVWDHSGCGLYPGDWRRTMKVLQESRVTDLFINVAGAGFAHYPSNILPRSKTFAEEGDQLRACLAAAEGTGIRVHAWILCFNATRASPERMDKFAADGWRLKSRDGKLTEYLDPSKPAVRKYILDAMAEIRDNYKVHGIHLDFVRWYERAVKPANAAEVISKFVAEARGVVRRPLWFTTAVLGKYPTCVASVGQDWDSWLNANLVDYVVPMDYTEDNMKLEEFLHQHAVMKSHARRTIVGIGVTANESRLGARQVIDQINLVRKYGLAGVSLFDLDVTLETNILPFLRLGMW